MNTFIFPLNIVGPWRFAISPSKYLNGKHWISHQLHTVLQASYTQTHGNAQCTVLMTSCVQYSHHLQMEHSAKSFSFPSYHVLLEVLFGVVNKWNKTKTRVRIHCESSSCYAGNDVNEYVDRQSSSLGTKKSSTADYDSSRKFVPGSRCAALVLLDTCYDHDETSFYSMTLKRLYK